MKIIQMLYCVSAAAFYRWAMREIPRNHPDVPKIIRRQSELADWWKKLNQT